MITNLFADTLIFFLTKKKKLLNKIRKFEKYINNYIII